MKIENSILKIFPSRNFENEINELIGQFYNDFSIDKNLVNLIKKSQKNQINWLINPFKFINLSFFFFFTWVSGFLTNEGIGNGAIAIVPKGAVGWNDIAAAGLSETLPQFDAVLLREAVVAGLHVVVALRRPSGKPFCHIRFNYSDASQWKIHPFIHLIATPFKLTWHSLWISWYFLLNHSK